MHQAFVSDQIMGFKAKFKLTKISERWQPKSWSLWEVKWSFQTEGENNERRADSRAMAYLFKASQWTEMEKCCSDTVCLLQRKLERVNWILLLLLCSLEIAACIPVGKLNNPCLTPNHSTTCYWESACWTALSLLIITSIHSAQLLNTDEWVQTGSCSPDQFQIPLRCLAVWHLLMNK